MVVIYTVADDARRDAAQLALAWGFPRPIAWAEWSGPSVWLANAPLTGVAWLCQGPLHEGDWLLHAQQAPHAGTRLPGPEVFAAIREQAVRLGARRVYAGLGSTRPGWQRWLMRHGFDKRDEVGPYMEMGGEGDAQA